MRTNNFVVDAPTDELAQEIANQAEVHRRELAIRWTGEELPDWETPCLLFVAIEEKPWAWTYHHGGEVRGMSIRGSREDIFNHSLPHEICHTVLLTYFGDTLPRWCDEGIAVSSEIDCPHRLNGRWGKQPLSQLFEVKRYPEDWESFYGQGFSVTKYIIEKHGRPKFFRFIRQGCRLGWDKACNLTLKTTLAKMDHEWRQWHDSTFGPSSRCKKYGE